MSEEEGVIAENPAEETASLEGQQADTPKSEVEEKEVEASPEAEPEEQKTAEERLAEVERARDAMQKKIDRQTAANHKTQELYNKQRQENEKLQALIKKQEPESAPNVDNFETHEEYNKAVLDYTAKKAKAEAQQEFLEQQRRVQREQQEREMLQKRQAQEAEYIVKNPMYNQSAKEVGEYIKSLDTSPAVEEAFISQVYDGNVPAIIDYFGANNGERLDELGEISRMSPPQVAVAIYKLQQKLSNTPVKKETKPSSPTPVSVAKGESKARAPLAKQSAKNVLDWVNS